MTAGTVMRMHGDLGRWEGEDEPPTAGVDRPEVEHVPEELSGGVGVVGVDNCVRTDQHHHTLATPADVRPLTGWQPPWAAAGEPRDDGYPGARRSLMAAAA